MSQEDRLILKLLEVDAAFPNRAHGRFIAGEPQAVVELLNESEDLDDREALAIEGTRYPNAEVRRDCEFKPKGNS